MKYQVGIGIGFLVATLGVLVGAGMSAESTPGPAATPAIQIDRNDLVESVRHNLREYGAVPTREALQESYRDEPSTKRHSVGHTYGRVLFEELDTTGFGYCDGGFVFGCYHEFFARVIQRDGVAVTSKLNDECFSANDRLPDAYACQHGIGHGLLAHGGYELDNLRRALELCNGLDPIDPINGCYGGAVMEFNMKTMIREHGIPPRTREEADNSLHYPCQSVPGYATKACYYWQSQWWLFALQATPERVGELCLEASTQRERDACFFGVGNRMPDLTDQPDEAHALCQRFTASTAERQHFVDCMASAAVTYQESGLPQAGVGMCQFLSGAEYQYCDKIRENK